MSVSDTLVLADHHALFLDLITMGMQSMPTKKKYKINNLTKEEWDERNERIARNPQFERLEIQAQQDHNVQNIYQQLVGILKRTFKDRHLKAKQSDDWEAEADFERLHAHHELYPKYEKAKAAREEMDKNHLINEMCRSDWKQFLQTVSTGDLKRVFQYFAKKDGRTKRRSGHRVWILYGKMGNG